MIAALVLYAAAMLAVGFLSARPSSRSGISFLLGDRGFGLAATWAALSSTTIGGTSTLVLAALVATKGLPGIWLTLSGAIGLLFLGGLLAEKVRSTNGVTLPEVIGRTYGISVRRVASVLVVLAEVVWFALLTQATETVITAATNWDPTAVLTGTAAVFIVYTAAGGQRAVIGTDLIQFALMVSGILFVALPLAVISLGRTGWPVDLIHFPTGPKFSLVDIGAMLILTGLPHMVGSDVWGKLLSARDARTAKRAAFGAAFSKAAFSVAVTVIAFAGVSLGLTNPAASLFPRAILELVGPSLAPFLLVVMVATMQASSDSVLLSAAAITGHDMTGGRGSPALLRFFVVFYGLLGLAVAFWMRDVIETFRLGYTIFAAGLILPTLVSFQKKLRVLPVFASAAMVAGGGAALLAKFFGPPSLEPVIVGTAVNALILVAGLRQGPPR